jgi:hypothetical protein
MKHFAVSLFAIILTGCGLFGGNVYDDVNIDSTRKAIVVANAELRATNLLLKEVIQSRAISKEQAQKALDGLQKTQDYLQQALNAVDIAGDIVQGQDLLDSAIMSLDIVLEILAPAVEPPEASNDGTITIYDLRSVA